MRVIFINFIMTFMSNGIQGIGMNGGQAFFNENICDTYVTKSQIHAFVDYSFRNMKDSVLSY